MPKAVRLRRASAWARHATTKPPGDARMILKGDAIENRVSMCAPRVGEFQTLVATGPPEPSTGLPSYGCEPAKSLPRCESQQAKRAGSCEVTSGPLGTLPGQQSFIPEYRMISPAIVVFSEASCADMIMVRMLFDSPSPAGDSFEAEQWCQGPVATSSCSPTDRRP